MDLNKLVISKIPVATKPIEAELVGEVCCSCECIEARETAAGICSICGAKWEKDEGYVDDDDMDDFDLSLSLLSQATIFFTKILNDRKVCKKTTRTR